MHRTHQLFTLVFAATLLLASTGLVQAQHVACDSYPCGGCDAGLGGGCTSGCGDCGSDRCGCPPDWVATVDALFLQRDDPSDGVLAFNTVTPSQNLDAGQFNFGSQAGVDVSLRRVLGKRNALELRYFGADSWDASAAVATTFNDLLRFNAAVPVFTLSGNAIASRYESELHNAEINFRHMYYDWLGLLAGFRYLEVDERGSTSLVGSAIPFDYRLSASSRLYGGQFGLDACLWSGSRFHLDVIGKAGVYGNDASHNAFITTGVATLTANGSDNRASLVAEFGATGAVSVTECVKIRGGYRLLWLDGVAEGTEQLAASNFDTSTGINSSGNIFYHGAFVGLELTH